MVFEFIVACRVAEDEAIQQVINNSFAEVVEDDSTNLDAVEGEPALQFLYERRGDESIGNDGIVRRHVLIGFVIELPEETESAEDFIEGFIASLRDGGIAFHVVKFEDPLLKAELAERASEIFALEMKLRLVLSLIYLHEHQNNEPFNLLERERMQTPKRERPNAEQMKAAVENQFFHLNFSQYINLNQKANPQLERLLTMIENSEQYDTFRAEILRNPIQNKEDADLIASLKGLMDPIENMRNCVAHNRRPTKSISDSYPSAKLQLEESLDAYLAQWKIS